MARPLRIEYPGAFYHVLNRGIERRAIFKQDQDYPRFLSRILEAHRKYGLVCHTFCLMPNHYHLLLETPHANLSLAMRHVDGFYTQDFNRRHKRVGPLFQGRYKAILIEKESYAMELSRYIHLNPVKAGLVPAPQDYPHSSYRYFYRKEPAPVYLDTHWLLSQFSPSVPKAREKFHTFTLQGLGMDFDPLKSSRAGCLLGREAFCEEIRHRFLQNKDDEGIPTLRKIRQTIPQERYEQIVRQLTTDAFQRRALLIYALRHATPLTLRQIGERVGNVSSHAVSKIASRLKERRKREKSWDRLLTQLEEGVSKV